MQTIELPAGGRARRAHIVRPACEGPVPAVIMLHGAGGTARLAANQTGWASRAGAEGFIAAFPEGSARDPSGPPDFLRNPQTWNDGSGRGHVARDAVDDVAFVAALLDRLIDAGADPGALFVTGFSNGGSLAFRVGTELADRVAAIAPVAGHCWVEPAPGAVVPLLYLIGDADPLNPMEGGTVRTPWGQVEEHPAPRRSLERWAGAAGCPLEDGSREEDGVSWSGPVGCPVPMRMGVIHGHGHIWPGGPRLLPETIAGPAVRSLRATDAIWRFFQHRLAGPGEP